MCSFVLSGTFTDFAKFKDITRTWEMNGFPGFPGRVGTLYCRDQEN